MVDIDTDKKCFDYETYHEGENKVLKIYLESCAIPPSIEYSPECMAKVIDLILKVSGVTNVVLSQRRSYDYDFSQVEILIELARLYHKINKEERYKYSFLVTDPLHERYIRGSYAEFQRISSKLLKEDPLSAYVKLKRLERGEKVKLDNLFDPRHKASQQKYFTILQEIIHLLENTKLIKNLLPHIKDYKLGDRQIYSYIFHPLTKPDFMYTKLLSEYPVDSELLDSYTFGDNDKTEVNIFGFEDSIRNLYHISTPEMRFNEEEYELLDDAKRILSEHKPGKEEFVDPERMREVFFNISRDLITDLAAHKNLKLRDKRIEMLARTLLRFTVGFGLIEMMLTDPKIQDVNINSPNGSLPIFIVHQDFGDCYTNVYPTPQEVDSWATKLRLMSGRPLDEANPILDTEISTSTFTARVSAVTAPLDPFGLGFSFRRHRDHPWTFPLYMIPKFKMMNKVAAGLLSFLIDGNVTLLIAGTRSSGKSSLLGSVLVEIMRRYRIITIEDTLELPCDSLRKLGYNIESLKVGSALSLQKGSEVDASTGIRSTLRLGDSALFVGEVRSKEAISLYEAMRVGAAANVVAGTIHAASPYGVYDRVVNDIGVPKTSFKATDIIVIANPVRSASGLHKLKRVLRVTEVRKTWENDPLSEGAFVDLMVYNPQTDELEVTKDLMNGNSEILKRIAGNIKDFAGDWNSVWENILLRGDCKEAIVEAYTKTGNGDLLEADFVIKANDKLHIISGKIREEYGRLDSKRILFEYKEWLRKEVRKMKGE
ncbi:type II/IV secretion system ATPase subunit [archaeon]|nr:type II/IV secretion system ATPase subunit [archaeon]MBT7508616.1 type II/IV secretion system ATPase subunit [archaeon]